MLDHQGEHGSQYAAIRSVAAKIGCIAETVIGLFKTEVVRRRGPWRSCEAVEFATLEWVDGFNNHRLLEALGQVPPAEAGVCYYVQLRPA